MQRVYDYLLRVPRGKVVTYGQIAVALGDRRLCRYVGNVLHRNPDGERYPCYKVVNSRGMLSAHYAFGGKDEQMRRLEAEGIEVIAGRVDLLRYQMK